jgi:hypothetical protein
MNKDLMFTSNHDNFYDITVLKAKARVTLL